MYKIVESVIYAYTKMIRSYKLIGGADVVSQKCNFVLVHRGMLSDGSRHKFNRKGVVAVQGQNVSTERGLELAIEVGAEDVQESEDEDEQPLLQVRLKDATSVWRKETEIQTSEAV